MHFVYQKIIDFFYSILNLIQISFETCNYLIIIYKNATTTHSHTNGCFTCEPAMTRWQLTVCGRQCPRGGRGWRWGWKRRPGGPCSVASPGPPAAPAARTSPIPHTRRLSVSNITFKHHYPLNVFFTRTQWAVQVQSALSMQHSQNRKQNFNLFACS